MSGPAKERSAPSYRPGRDPRSALALAGSRPATLGAGRLVCVDGPAGSGKTTFAGRLGGQVVHLDDLLEGWSGLPTVHDHVLGLLGPLAAGRPGRWRRWDWPESRWAEEHVVRPGPLLVIEGVGAGQRAWAEWTTVLVWVEAPEDERLARGLARDGESMRRHWERFMRDERALFARERTRERADLVVRT